MTATIDDLRSALRELADQAPPLDALHHRAWRDTADVRRARRRPPGRVLAALAAAAVVAGLAVGATVAVSQRHDNQVPARVGDVPVGSLEARPLVAPPVAVAASGPYRIDPTASLDFPVPTTDTGYDALTTAQQQELRTALSHTDCAAQAGSTATWRVACDRTEGTPRQVYLLGPVVFGRSDVRRATPEPPIRGIPSGSTRWTVALTLDRSGAARWHAFTAQHNSGGAGSSSTPVVCAADTVPCADYVAFVVDGVAVSVPVTESALSSQTQISGNFTEQTARALARELR